MTHRGIDPNAQPWQPNAPSNPSTSSTEAGASAYTVTAPPPAPPPTPSSSSGSHPFPPSYGGSGSASPYSFGPHSHHHQMHHHHHQHGSASSSHLAVGYPPPHGYHHHNNGSHSGPMPFYLNNTPSYPTGTLPVNSSVPRPPTIDTLEVVANPLEVFDSSHYIAQKLAQYPGEARVILMRRITSVEEKDIKANFRNACNIDPNGWRERTLWITSYDFHVMHEPELMRLLPMVSGVEPIAANMRPNTHDAYVVYKTREQSRRVMEIMDRRVQIVRYENTIYALDYGAPGRAAPEVKHSDMGIPESEPLRMPRRPLHVEPVSINSQEKNPSHPSAAAFSNSVMQPTMHPFAPPIPGRPHPTSAFPYVMTPNASVPVGHHHHHHPLAFGNAHQHHHPHHHHGGHQMIAISKEHAEAILGPHPAVPLGGPATNLLPGALSNSSNALVTPAASVTVGGRNNSQTFVTNKISTTSETTDSTSDEDDSEPDEYEILPRPKAVCALFKLDEGGKKKRKKGKAKPLPVPQMSWAVAQPQPRLAAAATPIGVNSSSSSSSNATATQSQQHTLPAAVPSLLFSGIHSNSSHPSVDKWGTRTKEEIDNDSGRMDSLFELRLGGSRPNTWLEPPTTASGIRQTDDAETTKNLTGILSKLMDE